MGLGAVECIAGMLDCPTLVVAPGAGDIQKLRRKTLADEAAAFDESFFLRCPASIADWLPEAAWCEEVVRVIDIPRCTGGMTATVLADPERPTTITSNVAIGHPVRDLLFRRRKE